jgi:hypothetical protein
VSTRRFREISHFSRFVTPKFAQKVDGSIPRNRNAFSAGPIKNNNAAHGTLWLMFDPGELMT